MQSNIDFSAPLEQTYHTFFAKYHHILGNNYKTPPLFIFSLRKPPPVTIVVADSTDRVAYVVGRYFRQAEHSFAKKTFICSIFLYMSSFYFFP
jgi:hypothetical protein